VSQKFFPPPELLPSDQLLHVNTSSANMESTIQCTIATGQTLDSEESNDGDEV
jgi:hypothetical protein